MFDFTGTRFDFPVTAGIEEQIVLEFDYDGGGGSFDLTGATFQCRATRAAVGVGAGEKEVQELHVEHGESGELVVWVPGLATGSYNYELFATAEDGDVSRMLYGKIAAMASEQGEELVQKADKVPFRVMKVTVPAESGRPLELRWKASSVAQMAAVEAKGVLDSANNVLDEVRAAAESVTGNVDEIKKYGEKLEEMEGRLDAIDEHILQSVVPNPVTNTWWIAGKDTHYQVTGDPGQSPVLDENGYWWVYDDALHEYVNSGINARGEDGRCPIIGSNGNWLHWNQTAKVWEDTGVRAMGKDGINGSAVRRIIVDEVEDIPAEGDTCNGSVYYYIPLVDAQPVAIIDVLDAAAGGFTVNGCVVTYSAQESRESAAGAVATGVRTALGTLPGLNVETDGSRVILTADILGWTFEALDTERYTVEEHVRMKPLERYDVYAWLEQPDGTSGWVCVGEANDIATSEIYGLVKTATDVVVRDGAPVGNNEQGQMSVPMAGQAVSGSVRISFADVLEDGGRIGFDADKRMRGEPATFQQYGDVKLSYSGDQMTEAYGTIGRRRDGTIGVRWATLEAPGVIRLGSLFGQKNPIPYQQGVGATTDHQLANNLLYGGALKHQRLGWWESAQMGWLQTLYGSLSAEERQYLNDTDYYIGLHTSNQFTQSQAAGLELRSATASLLAGVYIAAVMGDTRENAVPSAATITGHLADYYYTKSQLYKKSEIDSTVSTLATKRELASNITSVNTNLTNNYYTKTQADGKFAARTSSWVGDVVLTENEYNALSRVNPKIKYFLVAES